MGETFKKFDSNTKGKEIADAMNKNSNLASAYIFPFQTLSDVNIFKRTYLGEKVKLVISAIPLVVEGLGNMFICLFTFWILTACLMITLIVYNCLSGEEGTPENYAGKIEIR